MAQENDFPQMKRMTMLARLCEVLQMAGHDELMSIGWNESIGAAFIHFRYQKNGRPDIMVSARDNQKLMLKVIRAVIGDGIGGEAYDAEK